MVLVKDQDMCLKPQFNTKMMGEKLENLGSQADSKVRCQSPIEIVVVKVYLSYMQLAVCMHSHHSNTKIQNAYWISVNWCALHSSMASESRTIFCVF